MGRVADTNGAKGSNGVDGVDGAQRALGGFLRARRERVSPERVGLTGGGRRRVPGLRREELALLAGISVDYYVRLEQGRATQPSAEVLEALARALNLDAAERRHLTTLASGRRGAAPCARVSPLLQRIFDDLTHVAAVAMDDRLNVVAWNALGAALFGGVDDPGRRDPNQARFLFFDPAARELYPEWEERAVEAAGQLRVAMGKYPDDPGLRELISELSAHSAEFRRSWAAGGVVMCGAGRKRLRHPVAGPLTLDYETLHVPAVPGETGVVIHMFGAPNGTTDALALDRLAGSGLAVNGQARPHRVT